MFPKDFIVEDGIVYYRKKPLYKQPLFWTTVVGAVMTFILGATCFFLLIALGVSESDSALSNYDTYDSYSDSYDSSDSYTDYEFGETATGYFSEMEVTVLSIEKDKSIELVDDYYSTAIVVTLEVENTTDEDYYFDEYSFSLVDTAYEDYYHVDNRTFDSAIPQKIKAGEKVKFKLIYGADDVDTVSFRYEDAEWIRNFEDSY
ncbi:TPA: DUF4352 domain-containing protein [Streptococcus suis]|nr:DUF4352 domain-containing protein [Streptococcus suis]